MLQYNALDCNCFMLAYGTAILNLRKQGQVSSTFTSVGIEAGLGQGETLGTADTQVQVEIVMVVTLATTYAFTQLPTNIPSPFECVAYHTVTDSAGAEIANERVW